MKRGEGEEEYEFGMAMKDERGGGEQNDKPNAMTIGWATLGIVWGKPILTVYVRPSRYTFGLIEKTGDFTVNVLPRELEEIASFCGNISGRDCDKFEAKGLVAVPSGIPALLPNRMG